MKSFVSISTASNRGLWLPCSVKVSTTRWSSEWSLMILPDSGRIRVEKRIIRWLTWNDGSRNAGGHHVDIGALPSPHGSLPVLFACRFQKRMTFCSRFQHACILCPVCHFNSNGARGRITIEGDRSSTSKIISTRSPEKRVMKLGHFWNDLVGQWHPSRVHWPSLEQKSLTERLLIRCSFGTRSVHWQQAWLVMTSSTSYSTLMKSHITQFAGIVDPTTRTFEIESVSSFNNSPIFLVTMSILLLIVYGATIISLLRTLSKLTLSPRFFSWTIEAQRSSYFNVVASPMKGL